jgi:Arc/MetJ family transcription regulator
MRTNVVIDDHLMKKALNASGLKTKKAVIEHGLELVISLKNQRDIRSLRGKLSWQGNLDELRKEQ